MRPRTSRLIRASPLTSATLPSRKTPTSMPRCASVRATTKPSPPLLPRPHSTPTWLVAEILERRLHRRHRLPAGVLHQHDRRDADLVDRLPIGLAHLLRVEHSHRSQVAVLVTAWSLPDCRSDSQLSAAVAAAVARCHGSLRIGTMRGAVYVNGTIAPADQAVIPVYDHGFVYGEGVYETLRTYNRVPFLYDRHMRGCAVRRPPPPRRAVRRRDAAARGSIRRWPPRPRARRGYIRILLTRGVGDLTYDLERRRRHRS